ncbi:12779_t:CDS:2 [Rhizophagus irregularis]|nr:12779_t:CDS:2 [Rhizophagus irregularis]
MDTSMEIINDSEVAAQQAVSTVVSNAPNNSGLMVALHPLTLLNISDHFTRVRMQEQIQSPQVIGALVGTQTGREVEITNSFELAFDVVDGKVIVNVDYFTTKQDQFRQVFPQFDFLGWYTLGRYPTESDIEIHKQMMTWNESPLFLQMNPFDIVTSKNLPITVYESIIDLIDGQAQTLFIKSQYKIETGEAERISVDHVAHTTLGEGGEGSSHESCVDHDVLRQIAGLCNRLPTIDSADFRQEFLTEYNDVLLTSYLATITKGTNCINELVDKFNIATSTNKSGGRSRHQHQGFSNF